MKEFLELLIVVAVVGIPVGFSVNNSIFKVGGALEEKLNELHKKVDALQEKLEEIEANLETEQIDKTYVNPIDIDRRI
jgi:prefoldin subunit 5